MSSGGNAPYRRARCSSLCLKTACFVAAGAGGGVLRSKLSLQRTHRQPRLHRTCALCPSANRASEPGTSISTDTTQRKLHGAGNVTQSCTGLQPAADAGHADVTASPLAHPSLLPGSSSSPAEQHVVSSTGCSPPATSRLEMRPSTARTVHRAVRHCWEGN